MLIESTLFGTTDKVAVAIERLRAFEAQALSMHEGGYHVAFSGGKDSIVVLDLVRRAGVKHTAHMSLTTVDPPELIAYVKEHYPDVERVKPRMGMFALIRHKMMPPTRLVRFCCGELKETQGAGRMIVTGVRWAESVARSRRRMTETCMRDKRKAYLHPIIDWSDADVWEYIRERGLPYCSLYDEGFRRIGCIGCPMAGRKEREIEFARWPRYELAYRAAFGQAAAKRAHIPDAPFTIQWRDGDTMWDWWMNEDRAPRDDENQAWLFE